jgi:outer membrane protein TolC
VVPGLFLIGSSGHLGSQEILTVTDASVITLENNYGIQIARKNIEIAQNNASKENTGYLPTLSANAGGSFDIGGSTQKFGNGNENKVRNAVSLGSSESISLNYTLFDRSRAYTLSQLEEVLNMSDLQLRSVIESNVLQLVTLYYQTAQLSANRDVLEEAIEVGKRRLQRVRYQYEYGQGIRLDVLNAEVDVQRDSINLLNTSQQLANSKRNLNVLMGRDVDEQFLIDTLVIYEDMPDLANLVDEANKNNIEILISNNKSGRIPVISTNASYSHGFQDNPSGSFITSSTNHGLGVGVNISWNIFDGGIRKIREQNVLIDLETQEIQQQQLLKHLEAVVVNAWESYQNALFILEAERTNLSTNQLNFGRTEEQFNVGQVTSVEFRQAQLNLMDAQRNFNLAKYDAKIIEAELLQLAGRLLR